MTQQIHLPTCPDQLNSSSTSHRTSGNKPFPMKRESTMNMSTVVCQVEIIVTEKCLHKRNNHPAIGHFSDFGCWMCPILSEWLGWLKIVIEDWDRGRWVWAQSQSLNWMVQMMHNWEPRWPCISSRSKCAVSSKDVVASWRSPQQKQAQRRWPLSKTGWITKVLPDGQSCSAWIQGYMGHIQLSMIWRCFRKRSHQYSS